MPISVPAVEESDEVDVAPVIVDGMTILYMCGTSAYPAAKRAEQIAAGIRSLADDRRFPESTLRIEERVMRRVSWPENSWC